MKTSFNSISVCVCVCVCVCVYVCVCVCVCVCVYVCESYVKVTYTYDVIELFHFQLPNFLLKFVYFKNQKISLGKRKNIFYNFLRAFAGEI